MFKSRTVFVVGAGASDEFGLPTGPKLVSGISKLLKVNHDSYQMPSLAHKEVERALLAHNGQTSAHRPLNNYYDACALIHRASSQMTSIDTFLDHHRDNEFIPLCGKIAIAQCILDAERESKFRTRGEGSSGIDFSQIEQSWLDALFRLLYEQVPRKNVKGLFENVGFIVFNYDRCVEHFLLNALINYYDIPNAEAIEIVNSVDIVHPYGQTGGLPWQHTKGQRVPFGSRDSTRLLDIGSGIRTYTEQIESRNSLNQVRNLVKEADSLVFLGFAFHEQNMALMQQRSTSAVRRVFGTVLGESSSSKSIIEKRIHSMLATPAARLNLEDMKCAGLFKEYRRALTT